MPSLRQWNGDDWQNIAGRLSGLASERPAPAANLEGFLYYATDTEELTFCVPDGENFKWTTPKASDPHGNEAHSDNFLIGVGTSNVFVQGHQPASSSEGDIWISAAEATTEPVYLAHTYKWDGIDDGDPWPSADWAETNVVGGGVIDTQGGRGRMRSGDGGSYSEALRARSTHTYTGNVSMVWSVERDPGWGAMNGYWGACLMADTVWGSSDWYGAQNSYVIDFLYDGRWWLAKSIDGDTTFLGSGTEAAFPQHAQMRFECSEGEVKVKIWDKNDPEPAEWLVEVEDSSLSSGHIVIGSAAGNSADEKEVRIDEVKVYTDEDPEQEGVYLRISQDNSWKALDISASELAGYKEKIVTLGSSGTQVLDFAEANVWRIDPTAAVTFEFANLPAAGQITPGTLIIENSDHAVTWPTGTKHPDDTPPELDGETWLSIVALDNSVTVGVAWGNVV